MMLGFGKVPVNCSDILDNHSITGSDNHCRSYASRLPEPPEPHSGTRSSAGSGTETKLTMAPESPTAKYQARQHNLRHWLRMILI